MKPLPPVTTINGHLASSSSVGSSSLGTSCSCVLSDSPLASRTRPLRRSCCELGEGDGVLGGVESGILWSERTSSGAMDDSGRKEDGSAATSAAEKSLVASCRGLRRGDSWLARLLGMRQAHTSTTPPSQSPPNHARPARQLTSADAKSPRYPLPPVPSRAHPLTVASRPSARRWRAARASAQPASACAPATAPASETQSSSCCSRLSGVEDLGAR